MLFNLETTLTPSLTCGAATVAPVACTACTACAACAACAAAIELRCRQLVHNRSRISLVRWLASASYARGLAAAAAPVMYAAICQKSAFLYTLRLIHPPTPASVISVPPRLTCPSIPTSRSTPTPTHTPTVTHTSKPTPLATLTRASFVLHQLRRCNQLLLLTSQFLLLSLLSF